PSIRVAPTMAAISAGLEFPVAREDRFTRVDPAATASKPVIAIAPNLTSRLFIGACFRDSSNRVLEKSSFDFQIQTHNLAFSVQRYDEVAPISNLNHYLVTR